MAESKRIERGKLRPGVWLKRKNSPKKPSYAERPFDLIRVEKVTEDKVYFARFDRFEGEEPVFGRHNSSLIALMYLRRYELTNPPVPPAPKASPVPPTSVSRCPRCDNPVTRHPLAVYCSETCQRRMEERRREERRRDASGPFIAELRAIREEIGREREEIRQSRAAICYSIDALVVAWIGRRPDVSKVNGSPVIEVTP